MNFLTNLLGRLFGKKEDEQAQPLAVAPAPIPVSSTPAPALQVQSAPTSIAPFQDAQSVRNVSPVQLVKAQAPQPVQQPILNTQNQIPVIGAAPSQNTEPEPGLLQKAGNWIENQAKFAVAHPGEAALKVGSTILNGTEGFAHEIAAPIAYDGKLFGAQVIPYEETVAGVNEHARQMNDAQDANILAAMRKTTDPVKKAHLRDLLNTKPVTMDPNEIQGFNDTPLQVAGNAAGILTDVLTAGSLKPASAALQAPAEATVLGTAGKNALIGGIYGAESAAQNNKTDVGSYAESIGTGAAAGGLLSLAASGLGKAWGALTGRGGNSAGAEASSGARAVMDPDAVPNAPVAKLTPRPENPNAGALNNPYGDKTVEDAILETPAFQRKADAELAASQLRKAEMIDAIPGQRTLKDLTPKVLSPEDVQAMHAPDAIQEAITPPAANRSINDLTGPSLMKANTAPSLPAATAVADEPGKVFYHSTTGNIDDIANQGLIGSGANSGGGMGTKGNVFGFPEETVGKVYAEGEGGQLLRVNVPKDQVKNLVQRPTGETVFNGKVDPSWIEKQAADGTWQPLKAAAAPEDAAAVVASRRTPLEDSFDNAMKSGKPDEIKAAFDALPEGDYKEGMRSLVPAMQETAAAKTVPVSPDAVPVEGAPVPPKGNIVPPEPGVVPPVEQSPSPVKKLLTATKEAEQSYNEVQQLRTVDRSQRIAAGDAAYEAAGGGEAGVRAKMKALAGSYDKSGFNPIALDEATQTDLLNTVQQSEARPFEKLQVQQALRKIWGAVDEKPTQSDVLAIRKFFGEDGEELAKAVEEAVSSAPSSWREKLVEVMGIPRTAMTTLDFSMGLRQGGPVAARNLPEWANANVESVKYAFDTDYFKKAMGDIIEDDGFSTITQKMRVRLPAVLGDHEELVNSAGLLEKIPLYGKGVAASDRAYTGGLTKLRYNIAKQWLDSIGGVDEALSKMSDKDLLDMGNVINTFTGSGGRPGGWTERNMTTLSSTLFAPRLWASRLSMLNPVYYASLAPVARNRALQYMGSFLGTATTALTLGLATATAAGKDASVDLDPRSSDFLKLRIDNTRYDVLGGLQQNIVLLARLATGQKVSSETGELATLGDGYGAPSRFDVVVDAITNKLNPLLGYAAELAQSGHDKDGNLITKFGDPLNPLVEGAKMFAPLAPTGIADTYADTGNLPLSIAENVPAFFGVGVQTYGKNATKDGEKRQAELSDEEKLVSDKIKTINDTGVFTPAFRGILAKDEQTIYDKIGKGEKVSSKDMDKLVSGLTRGVTATEDTRYLEDGNYDMNLAALKLKRAQQAADPTTTEKELKQYDTQIKRGEIYKEKNVPYDLVDQYHKTSLAEWRALGDPKSDTYNPEMYQKLWDIDTWLTDGKVSRNTNDQAEHFYSPKKAKKGSGSGGGRTKASTNKIGDIVKLDKVSLGKLAQGQSTGTQDITTIPLIKAQDLKKRKISVS